MNNTANLNMLVGTIRNLSILDELNCDKLLYIISPSIIKVIHSTCYETGVVLITSSTHSFSETRYLTFTIKPVENIIKLNHIANTFADTRLNLLLNT